MGSACGGTGATEVWRGAAIMGSAKRGERPRSCGGVLAASAANRSGVRRRGTGSVLPGACKRRDLDRDYAAAIGGRDRKTAYSDDYTLSFPWTYQMLQVGHRLRGAT